MDGGRLVVDEGEDEEEMDEEHGREETEEGVGRRRMMAEEEEGGEREDRKKISRKGEGEGSAEGGVALLKSGVGMKEGEKHSHTVNKYRILHWVSNLRVNFKNLHFSERFHQPGFGTSWLLKLFIAGGLCASFARTSKALCASGE